MKINLSNILIGTVTSAAFILASGCCSVKTTCPNEAIGGDGISTLTYKQFSVLVKDLPSGCKELYQVAPGHDAETEKTEIWQVDLNGDHVDELLLNMGTMGSGTGGETMFIFQKDPSSEHFQKIGDFFGYGPRFLPARNGWVRMLVQYRNGWANRDIQLLENVDGNYKITSTIGVEFKSMDDLEVWSELIGHTYESSRVQRGNTTEVTVIFPDVSAEKSPRSVLNFQAP